MVKFTMLFALIILFAMIVGTSANFCFAYIVDRREQPLPEMESKEGNNAQKRPGNSKKGEQAVQVVLYTTPWCPYCHKAKNLLDKKGIAYKEINVTDSESDLREMIKKSGNPESPTVPQIFINDIHIGGYDKLKALEDNAKLDQMLGRSKN